MGTVKGRTRSPRIIHIWMITKNDAGVLTKRIKNQVFKELREVF